MAIARFSNALAYGFPKRFCIVSKLHCDKSVSTASGVFLKHIKSSVSGRCNSYYPCSKIIQFAFRNLFPFRTSEIYQPLFLQAIDHKRFLV